MPTNKKQQLMHNESLGMVTIFPFKETNIFFTYIGLYLSIQDTSYEYIRHYRDRQWSEKTYGYACPYICYEFKIIWKDLEYHLQDICY